MTARERFYEAVEDLTSEGRTPRDLVAMLAEDYEEAMRRQLAACNEYFRKLLSGAP